MTFSVSLSNQNTKITISQECVNIATTSVRSVNPTKILFWGLIKQRDSGQEGWSLRVKICPQSILHKSSENP